MRETEEQEIVKILEEQRQFFSTHATKDVDFRLTQLLRLKEAIKEYTDRIEEALWIDLHKSPEEAFLTEQNIVTSELNYHIKHVKQWSKPKSVKTPLHLMPSTSEVIYEPLGMALIIAPWNYPFQLLINSLIGSISAGCCCILKPSPDTPTVAKVMEEMITKYFDKHYIALLQGGKDTNTRLLAHRFDVIFFTGSPRVGKVVMKAAAQYLTPVVLELGGKSPCIVDTGADIDIAAKRIIWGKLINAGQTCIAPDYLLVHKSVKDELLSKMVVNIRSMYGEDAKQSRFYPRIVNESAMVRLSSLLEEGNIIYGGDIDKNDKYISPTIIDEVKPGFKVMQGEIFGPILPVMSYENIDEAIDYINTNEKPLALYYFGKNKEAKALLSRTTSGGGCINDTLMHITNHKLPFGGVGNSGLGKYHGKDSFMAFSNQRAIVNNPTWFDLASRYVPFRNFKFTRRLLE